MVGDLIMSSFFLKYHEYLEYYKKELNQNPRYPFSKIKVIKDKTQKNDFLDDYFQIRRDYFVFHENHIQYNEIFEEIAAVLSFMTPEYRENSNMQLIISLKIFSLYQQNTTIRYWFRKKLEIFINNFKKYNYFIYDLSSFFEFIPLKSFLLDFIARTTKLQDNEFYQAFYQFVLTYFIPTRNFHLIRDSDEIDSELKQLFTEKSQEKYLEYKQKYPFMHLFKIPYCNFNLTIIQISLYFSACIDLELISYIGIHPFMKNNIVGSNFLSFYLTIPGASITEVKSHLDHLRLKNLIKDFRIQEIKNLSTVVNYDNKIPSSALIEDIFPFCSKKYKKKIDLRSKRELSIRLHQKKFSYEYENRENLAINPIYLIILIFHQSLLYFPTPSSFSKYIQNIRSNIEVNPLISFFIGHSKNNITDFTHTTEKSENFQKILNLCDFPEDEKLEHEILTQLTYLSKNIKNFWRDLKYPNLVDILHDMFNEKIFIVDLPSSFIQTVYFRPELIDIYVISKSQYEILEKVSFFYEKNILEDEKGNPLYLYRFSTTCAYFDVYSKYFVRNSEVCLIFNYPYFSANPYFYPLTYYDFCSKSNKINWYNVKIKESFENLEKQLKKPNLKHQISEFTSYNLENSTNFIEFYKILNRVNGCIPIQLSEKSKKHLVDFFSILYSQKSLIYSKKQIQNLMKSKISAKSLSTIFSTVLNSIENVENHKGNKIAIMIIINTFNQNTHPEIMEKNPLWRGLFSVGLVDYHFMSSNQHSIHVLKYLIPKSVWFNSKSPIRRLIEKISIYGNDAVKIYKIKEKVSGINPEMIFPKDQISEQYLNLHFKKTSKEFVSFKETPQSHWINIPTKSINFTFLNKSMRTLMGYGVDILFFIEGNSEIPYDIIDFLHQHPIIHGYELESLKLHSSDKRGNNSKAFLAIISLDRYINTYYNFLIREMLSRFNPSQVLFSPILKYSWIYSETILTELLDISNNPNLNPLSFHLPLFKYRHRKDCFSTNFRVGLIKYLTKHEMWGKLTNQSLKELSRYFSQDIEKNMEGLNDELDRFFSKYNSH